MVKNITLLMCFLLVMSPLFAEVTAIKVHSETSGNEMLSLFDTRQAPPKALLWKDLKPGEDFLQSADIESGGYYKLIYHQCQYDIWMEPGKEVNITLKDNGEVDFAGEHAELNDFLAELRQKYPSRDKYSEELLKTHKVVLNLERFDDYNRQYHEQLQAVKQSALSKADKALANGWVQAVFLENVYKPVIENKVFGKTNRAEMETGYADECAKLDLFAEIVYYPEWGDYLQEVLYTRMKTGKLKLKNPDLWISEWGKTISDANLRDHFIDYLVRRETLMRYFDDKTIERFQAAKALVKDANTDELIEDFGYGNKGVIIYLIENDVEWISITLGTEEAYTVKVVQTINDYPEKDVHVEMKKGAVVKNNQIVGAISVFRVFDFTKDKINPAFFRTQVDGANIVFEFHDVSKINN